MRTYYSCQQLAAQLREAHGGSELSEARACYICKQPYRRVHFFYDSMCPDCGDLNYKKRDELTDLTGRVALVTGGRVKIGQEIVLKLLRCGARVIVTTRFAADAARRYAERADFADYRDRLQIYGFPLFLRSIVKAEAEATRRARLRRVFMMTCDCCDVSLRLRMTNSPAYEGYLSCTRSSLSSS